MTIPHIQLTSIMTIVLLAPTCGSSGEAVGESMVTAIRLDETGTTNHAAADDAKGTPAEVITERFANRSVRLKREVEQDSSWNYQNHGAWTQWSETGAKIAEGTYRHGKRHGAWMRWYQADEVKSMRLPAGKQFKTPIVSKAHFVDGQLHGLWTIVDAEGKSIASRELDHGQLSGTSILWFDNNTKHLTVSHRFGELHGEYLEWSYDGKPVAQRKYDNGREVKELVHKYKNGNPKVQGTILAAKEITKTEIDWWNAVVRMEVIDTVGKEERIGQWVYHYSNGEKSLQMSYVGDKLDGQLVGWHENGQTSVQGEYRLGKQEGSWSWWYDNGQKKIQGKFKNALQAGVWIQWKDDGKATTIQYHDGSERPAPEIKSVKNTVEITDQFKVRS